MNFSKSLDYPAPLSEVSRMLLDPEYGKARFASLSVQANVDVDQIDNQATVSYQILIPPASLPASVRSVIAEGLHLRLVEVWRVSKDGDLSTASISGSVKGVPLAIKATSTLESQTQATHRVFSGTVECSIPLMGASIEKHVVAQLETLIESERDAGAQYLARQ